MFSFFKKKVDETIDYSVLRADMHSHLIPGIDDGSPDMDTSVQLIEGMIKLGYKTIITTPHVISGMYNNTPEIIRTGCERVKQELRQRDIKVEFRAAAEYLLDENFDALLENNEPLLTLKDNLVLVEFSFVSPPMDFKQKLFSLQIKGYRPVLAHPERYGYFHHNPDYYDELKNAGCLFQVNILSLTGYYGKHIAHTAEQLIKRKFIDLLGSDLHHVKHLQRLNDGVLSAKIRKIADTIPLLNHQL